MKRPFALCVHALAFVVLLAGCAAVDNARPPTIELSNIRMEPGGGLLSQQFRLEIRVGNPNDFDLPLTGLTFRLDVNGHEFATGLSNETVTVPRLGYATVPVNGSTSIISIFRQLLTLGDGSRLSYRLHGDAFVATLGNSTRVPYERKGELSLIPDAPPGSGKGGQDGVRTLAPVGRAL